MAIKKSAEELNKVSDEQHPVYDIREKDHRPPKDFFNANREKNNSNNY